MAKFGYFADLANGTVAVSIDRANYHGNKPFIFHDGAWIAATRTIQLKSSPSRHDCDDRCMNATGRTMKCECACGGKNHGRGAFMCEAA